MTFIPSVLSEVDSNNSSSTLLNANASFTGTATNTTGYNTLQITVTSNVNSSPLGLQLQFSPDGSTWTTFYYETYFSPALFNKRYNIENKFFRIVYTNDGTIQTNFSLISRLSNDTPDPTKVSIAAFDNSTEFMYDSFGKMRVSNPNTLLDLRFPGQTSGNYDFYSNNLQIDKQFSGITGTYGNSKLVMSGAAGATSYYISQSRNYCVYQPGKSLLFMASSVINPGDIGFTNRLGYYDNDIPTGGPITTPINVRNGLFFQHNGTNCFVGLKDDGETLVPQSSWNIDKMDGTGSSKIVLDFTKAQLFVIDVEWLGVGRVRYGFYAFGQIVYCHQITNINVLTKPYTNNINLPVCFTMQGLTGSGTGSFTQICSTVISEGGYNPVGRPFSVSSSGIATTANTETPILAIRASGNASTNYKHQTIIPTNISAFDTSNTSVDLLRLRLYLGGDSPNSGGTISWNQVNASYSIAEYSAGASITAGGGSFTTGNSIVLSESYFSGKNNIALSQGLENVFSNLITQVTSNILNQSDILVITILPSATGTVYAEIDWNEVY